MKFSWALIFIFVSTSFSGMSVAAPAANEELKSIEESIYIKRRKLSMSQLYKSVLLAFENNGYFVTFEPNIGKAMRPYAQRWGKDYNKNNVEEIRSMVLSNPWHANKIANADPYLLAMFPITVTLIQKGNFTTILFVRPSKVAEASRGLAAAKELENDIIRIFEHII
ncbi:MAG: DUF302 domain-containing protein [Gammaproteobacteria bacterium]|nr:DUF302 domain-containing protein [Gammaproteobacteria bacterium]